MSKRQPEPLLVSEYPREVTGVVTQAECSGRRFRKNWRGESFSPFQWLQESALTQAALMGPVPLSRIYRPRSPDGHPKSRVSSATGSCGCFLNNQRPFFPQERRRTGPFGSFLFSSRGFLYTIHSVQMGLRNLIFSPFWQEVIENT